MKALVHDLTGQYIDGWEGITKKIFKEMYNTNSYNQPSYCRVSTGLGLDPGATLRANGLHPDKIPTVLRDATQYSIGKIIAEIAKVLPLTYVETPDE